MWGYGFIRFTSKAKASSPSKKDGIGVTLCESLHGFGKNVDLHVIPRLQLLQIPPSDWLPGEPRSKEIDFAFASAIARRTMLKKFL